MPRLTPCSKCDGCKHNYGNLCCGCTCSLKNGRCACCGAKD